MGVMYFVAYEREQCKQHVRCGLLTHNPSPAPFVCVFGACAVWIGDEMEKKIEYVGPSFKLLRTICLSPDYQVTFTHSPFTTSAIFTQWEHMSILSDQNRQWTVRPKTNTTSTFICKHMRRRF